MSEIALNVHNKHMPVGHVLDVFSEPFTRRKWIEFICDQASPGEFKRETYKHAKISGWKQICQFWDDTPGLRDLWLKAENRLINDYTYPQIFWDEHIKDTGLLSYIGPIPESDKLAYEVFPFKPLNRQLFFIVSNEDAAPAEVESWKNRRVFDFEGDEDISGDTLSKIKDKSKIVYTKFNKPIPKLKFKVI